MKRRFVRLELGQFPELKCFCYSAACEGIALIFVVLIFTDMQLQLQRFHREKALIFTLYVYPAFTLAGFTMVVVTHGNYNAIVLAALLFLLGPLVLIYLNKARFVQPATLTITDHAFRIDEANFPSTAFSLDEIESYQTEFTRSLTGSGYRLIFHLSNGSKRAFILYEQVFAAGTIREDSALYQLCSSIGRYNRQNLTGQAIELKPNLFSLKPASLVILITGLLLLVAIAVNASRHHGSRQLNIGGSLMIAVVLAALVFGGKRTDDAAYAQMKAIQGY